MLLKYKVQKEKSQENEIVIPRFHRPESDGAPFTVNERIHPVPDQYKPILSSRHA